MKSAVVPCLIDDGEFRGRQQDAVERVILVDPRDRPQGEGDKLEVHAEGILHRAFSIFVFNNDGELLLQRRAEGKYHFAGYWSNTCCGHPRPGEPTVQAAMRRLEEEFGFRTPLEEQLELVYRAEDAKSGLIEHEYLHVFRGRFVGAPRPDPAEIGAWRWISVPAVRRSLRKSPHVFSPWFCLIAESVFGQTSDPV